MVDLSRVREALPGADLEAHRAWDRVEAQITALTQENERLREERDRCAKDYGHECQLRDAAEAALAEIRDKHICPVCGSEEWTPDYDYTGDDEIQVDRCDKCQWPPPYPVTVQEWRRRTFFSEYLSDLEAVLTQREATLADTRRAMEEALAFLHGIDYEEGSRVDRAVTALERALAAGEGTGPLPGIQGFDHVIHNPARTGPTEEK